MFPDRHTQRATAGILCVVAALAVVIGVVIANDWFPTSRAALDQDNYHLRAVRTFAAQWEAGAIDFSDYRSATTPGYHLTLAAVSRFVSDDPRVVRAAGAVFTLGLVLALGMAALRAGAGRAWGAAPALLALPLACSLYVFSAGAWVLPDNAGWLGALGIIALVLLRPVGAGMLVLAGVMLLALVLVRQNQLWAAGLVWLAPWLGGEARAGAAAVDRGRLRLAALAVVATLPAFAAVALFARLWHGLVPPLFQGGVFDPVIGETSPKNSGINGATPAFLLTLLGLLGPFFLGYARRGVDRLLARDGRAIGVVVAGAVCGVLLGVIPATSFSVEMGRYTGFWDIARRLPAVADRSLFIAGGAAAGGALVGVFLASLSRRDAVVFLLALGGFAAAQSAAFFAWQRYLEPFALILLALMSARAAALPAPGNAVVPGRGAGRTPAPPAGGGREVFWRLAQVAGPVLLAVILAGISWASLHRPARQADPRETYAPVAPGLPGGGERPR